jgi:formiminoglutamase
MLKNWLTSENVPLTSAYAAQTIGAEMERFEETQTDLGETKLVILGLDASANAIRSYFYTYSYNFPKGKLMDLGNIKKNNPDFILPLLKELLSSGITVILLGELATLLPTQYKAYQESVEKINVVVLDEKITIENHLDALVNVEKQQLAQLTLLGYQSHFASSAALEYGVEYNFNFVRLGKIRNNNEETEPYLRNSDFLNFHIPVLKSVEIADQPFAAASGLSVEEGCQIAYYAGMSDRLSSVSFCDYQLPKKNANSPTAKAIAQMMWYFTDGFFHRNGDYPFSTKEMTEYIVDFKNSQGQMHFWKSNRSGRWWVQITEIINKKRHNQLIPCSYKDYELACKGELSERLS